MIRGKEKPPSPGGFSLALRPDGIIKNPDKTKTRFRVDSVSNPFYLTYSND